MMLYLVEGLVGFPVFSPGGPGGIAQLFGGVTGGYLLAYPFVAFTAGYVFERGPKYICPGRCRRDRSGGVAVHRRPGLALRFHSLLAKAAYLGLYWFIAAEVIKIMVAAGSHPAGAVRMILIV